MEIIGTVNDDVTQNDEESGASIDYGTHYNVLKCPTCERVY